MPANYTQNYKLNLWEPDDKVQRVDFNADNTKIDAALTALAGRSDSLSGSKADQSALNTLAQTVAAKADAAALSALESRVAAVEPKAGVRLISQGTPLAEDAAVYTVPFSGIDWNQWKTAYLVLNIKANTSNISIGRNSVQHLAKAYNGRMMLIFFPFFSEEHSAVGINFAGSEGENFVSLGSVFKSAQLVLHTYNDDKLLAGTTYEFWGEK